MGKPCKSTKREVISPLLSLRTMSIAQLDIAIASPATDWRDRDSMLRELQRRLREVRSNMALRAGRMAETAALFASMQASQASHAEHEASLIRSLQRWAPELVDATASIARSPR